MSLFPADDRRLRELILHVSLRCRDWEQFSSAVLDRILFQSDFLHFRRFGFPITGQAYRRGVRSPAPRALPRVLRAMQRAGEWNCLELPLADGIHVRRLPCACREPDLRIFDGREIDLVEQVIRFYHTHWKDEGEGPDFLAMPWQLAAPREEIPYHLALLGIPAEPDSRRIFRNLVPFESLRTQALRKRAHRALAAAS
jgi:hypothetical protein